MSQQPCSSCTTLSAALAACHEELTETRRARIGDSEIIGRWTCRAEKAEQQLAALTEERDLCQKQLAAVIDATDKHTRALHFQRTTPENIAALVDAICETASRDVQAKQAAEADLAALRSERDRLAKNLAEAQTAWNAENELRHDAQDDLAALHSQAQQERWQPIETCPKDKLVLFGMVRVHDDVIEGGVWPGDWEMRVKAGDEATHWQPWPEPPSALTTIPRTE